jgi:hypothetical protein
MWLDQAYSIRRAGQKKTKSMRKLCIVLGLAGILVMPSVQAAIELSLDGEAPVDPPKHNPSSANPTVGQIAALFSVSESTVGTSIYKHNVDGAVEEGVLEYNYTTTFGEPKYSGPITITWDGGEWANVSFLVVKDGELGSWIWDLRGLWDGKTTIEIAGDLFPHNQGFKDVSHVEFYGTPVPEPTTMIAGALLLLPFGLSALRMVRKNKKA